VSYRRALAVEPAIVKQLEVLRCVFPDELFVLPRKYVKEIAGRSLSSFFNMRIRGNVVFVDKRQRLETFW
jgi:hypothetical protein